MAVSAFVVDENVHDGLPGELKDCCILCGSWGVVHFQDASSGGDYEHRCLRCDATWTGCSASSSLTPKERLTTATKIKE